MGESGEMGQSLKAFSEDYHNRLELSIIFRRAMNVVHLLKWYDHYEFMKWKIITSGKPVKELTEDEVEDKEIIPSLRVEALKLLSYLLESEVPGDRIREMGENINIPSYRLLEDILVYDRDLANQIMEKENGKKENK